MNVFKYRRCKWCIARIGRVSWFDSSGYVEIDVVPDERSVSDGLCPQCYREQMAIIRSLNSQGNQGVANNRSDSSK